MVSSKDTLDTEGSILLVILQVINDTKGEMKYLSGQQLEKRQIFRGYILTYTAGVHTDILMMLELKGFSTYPLS